MKILGGLIFILVMIVGIIAISALVTMTLWNFLAGYFGFMKISFFVALVITLAIGFISSMFKSK